MSILSDIQAKLKAPKNQFNAFGKYNYRNCEDILLALKPLLYEADCSIIITDELELIGDRYYIKSTASLLYHEEKIIAQASAYAREPENKKGMDESQITGAASSYARKYALNGLFAIDDGKDADGLPPNGDKEKEKNKQKSPKQDDKKMPEPLSDSQLRKIRAMIGGKKGYSKESKNDCYKWIKSKADKLNIDGKDVITKKSAMYIIDNFDELFEEWVAISTGEEETK